MWYEIIASLESTAKDGKTTRIVKTGELPHFFIEADTPRQAIDVARAIVNPCGDANAVYVRVRPDADMNPVTEEAAEAA